jgi:Alanyl-tRNA synthetase
VVRDGAPVVAATAGDEVELILDATPFYAESGGQAGDRGLLVGDGVEVEVTDTKAPVPGLICHRARIRRGELAVGVSLTCLVDRDARAATARNHTGTHLLQAALREVLGDHVRQAGSLVAPDRLRFDLHHFAPIDEAQLREVERRVNEEIWRHEPVITRQEGLEEAVASGAMALFGERYGDKVRVVSVGDFSKELCGGTHVANSGDIGLLVIEREQGIAAGVRRIEAATGEAALAYLRRQGARLAEAAAVLKADPEQLTERVTRVAERERELTREVERLKRKLAEQEASQGETEEVNGVAVVVRDLGEGDADSLRQLADSLRAQGSPFVALLAARHKGKPLLLCAVDRSVTDRIQAGDVVKQVGRHIGGGGGGRPDLAQAGGKRVEGIADALEAGAALLRERLVE